VFSVSLAIFRLALIRFGLPRTIFGLPGKDIPLPGHFGEPNNAQGRLKVIRESRIISRKAKNRAGG